MGSRDVYVQAQREREKERKQRLEMAKENLTKQENRYGRQGDGKEETCHKGRTHPAWKRKPDGAGSSKQMGQKKEKRNEKAEKISQRGKSTEGETSDAKIQEERNAEPTGRTVKRQFTWQRARTYKHKKKKEENNNRTRSRAACKATG
jgi:hypothetical protein